MDDKKKTRLFIAIGQIKYIFEHGSEDEIWTAIDSVNRIASGIWKQEFLNNKEEEE